MKPRPQVQPLTDLLRSTSPLTPEQFRLVREYTQHKRKLAEVRPMLNTPMALTAGAALPDAEQFEPYPAQLFGME